MTTTRGEERGTAVVETTWLVLLLLVPLVYVLLAVLEVQRASYGVSAGARAAARAYSLAPDEASAPERARRAAEVALADQGLVGEGISIDVRCRPDPANCLAPGSRIDVEVRHQVALPFVPPALGEQAPSVRVHAEHTVGYGTYREDR